DLVRGWECPEHREPFYSQAVQGMSTHLAPSELSFLRCFVLTEHRCRIERHSQSRPPQVSQWAIINWFSNRAERDAKACQEGPQCVVSELVSRETANGVNNDKLNLPNVLTTEG